MNSWYWTNIAIHLSICAFDHLQIKSICYCNIQYHGPGFVAKHCNWSWLCYFTAEFCYGGVGQ